MNTQTDVILVPNRRHERTRTLALREPQWGVAFQLSAAAGYSPTGLQGLDRAGVRSFLAALRRAVELGRVTDPETRVWLEELTTFLAGDGAGGFVVERGWRNWRRAG